MWNIQISGVFLASGLNLTYAAIEQAKQLALINNNKWNFHVLMHVACLWGFFPASRSGREKN